MNVCPRPGSVYPLPDYDHQHQRQSSTPIYHFSNHYAPRPGHGASSDNIASAGPYHGGKDHGGSQYRGTQNEYPYTLSDNLAASQRRSSIEGAGSHNSLAYPPSNITSQKTRNDGFITHDNTLQLRQHEDDRMRLDVHHPQGSSPRQPQVVDLPPAYRPNY
jgi:hypothetical protein